MLPVDFKINKYGLTMRLITEADAEFIVSLRSDPERTKYMVTLEDNIEKQREWIREYKRRETEGSDYYFIYFNAENNPIGLNRASHIDYINKTCVASSFIVVEGLKYEAIVMLLIRFEVMFDVLKIETFQAECHKDNKKVVRIMELFGYKPYGETKKGFLQMVLTKEAHEASIPKIREMILPG
ncbi:MAG: GNAT family N-acetyltransferase [Syntrophales bacterium]|jgi:RimJ/RimL family protein N-acetyltransferase|nr:GNAT family N-acetyltransferase [Syntrophales bacterium]